MESIEASIAIGALLVTNEIDARVELGDARGDGWWMSLDITPHANLVCTPLENGGYMFSGMADTGAAIYLPPTADRSWAAAYVEWQGDDVDYSAMKLIYDDLVAPIAPQPQLYEGTVMRASHASKLGFSMRDPIVADTFAYVAERSGVSAVDDPWILVVGA